MIDKYEVSQRLLLHEGLKLMPYHCRSGKLTIGIGRNLEANPITPYEQKIIGDWRHGITRQQAFFLLKNDINRIEQALIAKISFWKKLDDERQYALLDMAFNLGVNGILSFTQMLKSLQQEQYQQASEQCLNSRYARQVPHRARRIANVLLTGKFII